MKANKKNVPLSQYKVRTNVKIGAYPTQVNGQITDLYPALYTAPEKIIL